MLARLPIVFGPAQRRLTGFFHPPEDKARALGVVLCNPLGYEAMSAHRTYRHLAERLAASGIAALRFDYDGTGNSPAASNGPQRIRASLESIHLAIAELRARAGVERVALLGTGFGATLATVAAAEEGNVESLVLWGPIVSGRAHARELRAFRLFKYSKANPAARTDGSEEIAGYLFSKEMLSDMSAIELISTAQPAPASPARRVLVLPRSDRPSDEGRLIEHLKARGAETQLEPDAGYAAMMRDDPYESVVPFEALDKIIAWLAEGTTREPKAPRLSPTDAEGTTIATGDHGTLRETLLSFGEGHRLFGILTEPTAPAGEKPAICFLNVGANHHVGPHRMNVELARELAEAGYPTLRFDVAGLGDSGLKPGVPENRIYTKDSIVDLQAALSLIEERGIAKRFVLVGLCSGAYLAFHTAVIDRRVTGQVLLSPYAFEWKEGDPVKPTERASMRAFRSTRFYTSALKDPQAWRLILKGQVDVLGISTAILKRALERLEAALPALSAMVRRQRRPQSEIERAFRDLADRKVETFVALGFEDGGVDLIAKYLGRDAARMRGYPSFRLEILHGVDHTFATVDSQSRLRGLLKGYLADRFA